MTDVKGCPLEQINPFDPDLLDQPHDYYARLREEAPVYRHPHLGIVSIATDALIREANLKPDMFSNNFGAMLQAGSTKQKNEAAAAVLAEGYPIVNTLLTADPPVHTRYRKLGMKGFTYKRVLGMDAYIRDTANALIDGFVDDGECDFRPQFADLLPMYIILDMLGADRSDLARFQTWSHSFVAQLGGFGTPEERVGYARDVVEFQHYFADVIEEKRANPTEDVISDLIHADLGEEGDTRKMDVPELLSFAQQIMVAGNESTANSLAAGLYYLIQHPEQMRLLRVDPALIPNFVEETLRLLAPSSNMWRVCVQDTELGGVEIKAGEPVLLRYGSANRDAAVYAEPDAFDVTRANAKNHLSFGAGIHTCIGAQLARREMIVAFGELLRRLDDIRLHPDQGPIRYTPNVLLRGPVALQIAFSKRA
ncbi:MAG: cytochrome P450 [Pseudomonadota bacterium]